MLRQKVIDKIYIYPNLNAAPKLGPIELRIGKIEALVPVGAENPP